MPILTGDIKLIASHVMQDVPEGGGAPTANAIQDGVSNAIFPDVSELDRAGGRVNLRKIFVSVVTADTDTYMGSNFIVAEPPEDPNISITLFSTRSTFDTRTDAVNLIESYLTKSTVWRGFLLENHVAGQRAIQIFQHPTAPTPTIGSTLVLVTDEGTPTEVEQYVRIIRTESTIGTYVDALGHEYTARVVTCDISDALRTPFKGSPPYALFTADHDTTRIRTTSVADAGAYFGVVPLHKAAALGDSTVTATSVYTKLVPSAATESVALDVKPSATRSIRLASSPRAIAVGAAPHSLRVKIGQESRAFNYVQILSPPPAPGTLEVSFLALGEWYSLNDDALGALEGQGAGTVNYTTGSVSVTLPVLPDIASSVLFTWGEKQAFSSRAGGVLFRAPEFSFDLAKKGIDPGSLVITWLSAGNLKTATAGMDGYLTGDATGFVAATTGMLTLRPSAMLDAGGEFSLSYTWSTVRTETKLALGASGGGLVTFALDEVPVQGSIVVDWFTTRSVSATSGSSLASGSSTKTTSGDSSTNSAQQSATKTEHIPAHYTDPFNYPVTISSGGGGAAGDGFYPPPSPPPDFVPQRDSVTIATRISTATVTHDTASGSYSKLTTTSAQVSETVLAVMHNITENGSGGFLNGLGFINYAGKSVTLKVVDPSTTANSYKNDTESGADYSSALTQGSNDPGQAASGRTDYIPVNSSSVSSSSGGSQSSQGGEYTTTAVKEVFDNTALYVTYRTGASTQTAHTETYSPKILTIDLAPHTKDRIVPGSVQFTWMGTVYRDFEGKLYHTPSGASPGVYAGTVDYRTGIANVWDYVVSGSPTNFSLDSLWVSKGPWTTSRVFFRTPAAPVKPGGLVFSILDVDGNQIIATADNFGKITGDHCMGDIDYQSGVVDLIFGDLVPDSTLTDEDKAEWWYAKALTQITAAGKVWRPWPVDPNSLRYNAVSYFYLPLDASILGVDPVRLPQDGRVPIFRPGGFAVVGHTGKITATVSNAQVIDAGRVRLSRVRVIGNDGVVINTGYTADLDAGTVTFTNVAGYSQPVTIEHRIEDMAVVRDVQINGNIGFTRALTHNYPLTDPPTSFISSALVSGDLKARVSTVFDQVTWTGVWADSAIGSAATGTFNDVAYPLAVTNAGAITERWALIFTNSSTFQIVGEHVGVIGTGSIFEAQAPLNPAAAAPYFTIPLEGWGIGWSAGNVLRINTIGPKAPVWVVRTVQQGPNTGTDHRFTLLSRGDVDRP